MGGLGHTVYFYSRLINIQVSFKIAKAAAQPKSSITFRIIKNNRPVGCMGVLTPVFGYGGDTTKLYCFYPSLNSVDGYQYFRTDPFKDIPDVYRTNTGTDYYLKMAWTTLWNYQDV